MSDAFSLADDQPFGMTRADISLDTENELKNPTKQRSADLRSVIASWYSRNKEIEQELHSIQEHYGRENRGFFIAIAREYFELCTTVKILESAPLEETAAGCRDRLVDVSTRIEEILRDHDVEIEDLTGKQADFKICDVKGSIPSKNLGSGLVVQSFSPIVRLKGEIIHRAEVIVSI